MDIRDFVVENKVDSRKVWQFTVIDEDIGEVLMITKARIAAENKLADLLRERIDWEEYEDNLNHTYEDVSDDFEEDGYREDGFDKESEIQYIINQKETDTFGIIVEEELVDL